MILKPVRLLLGVEDGQRLCTNSRKAESSLLQPIAFQRTHHCNRRLPGFGCPLISSREMKQPTNSPLGRSSNAAPALPVSSPAPKERPGKPFCVTDYGEVSMR